MKKIVCTILVSLTAICFCGCISQKNELNRENEASVMSTSPSDFGNEEYIWESWIFPSVNK